jgi:hypothetical protein
LCYYPWEQNLTKEEGLRPFYPQTKEEKAATPLAPETKRRRLMATSSSGSAATTTDHPSLKPKQVQRAAVEALTRLRPQPTAAQVTMVLEFLAELGADGLPKHKFADKPAAAKAAVAKAKELLDVDKKAAADAAASAAKAADEEQAAADKAAGHKP